jgi:hypothetical protein
MNAENPKTIFVKTALWIQMAYCNEPYLRSSAFIGGSVLGLSSIFYR